MLVDIAGVLAGAVLGAVLTWLALRRRLQPLIAAAERVARGERGVHVRPASGGLAGRLSSAVGAISTMVDRTVADATTDRLTGVANRQSLLGQLFAEVERSHRYERPLSVGFVDIDHFKAVNDTYGHHAGDVVLRGVADTIRTNLRATDVIGRYGGEEFMLILTETAPDEGAVLAEKLRQLILRQAWQVDGAVLTVTVSIGIAGGAGSRLSFETLVRDADAAMYSAKSLGRNQTYVFAEPDEDSRIPRAPISPDGRARAAEAGRVARDAARDALIAVVSPLTPDRNRPSELIAALAVAMAHRLDLPEAEVERLRVAALLHDIGNVGLPDEILGKPGSLTPDEWRSVVQHPRIGQVILEQATAIRDAVPIILHHHERFSGHGYPYGLRASEIPLGARIVAIADAYNAMVHDRPYKKAMSHARALQELRRNAGTQFDPELVALFCELFEAGVPELDERVANEAFAAELVARRSGAGRARQHHGRHGSSGDSRSSAG